MLVRGLYRACQLFMRSAAGPRRGLLEVSVGRRREPDRRQSALSWPRGRGRERAGEPMRRRHPLPSVLPGLAQLGAPCNYEL